MAGEELWRKPAGPRNVSLEGCDLGVGAGVVEGAYARLPRYFPDTGKVQHLESRLLTCMETLQAIDTRPYVDARFGTLKKDELITLVTLVSGLSKDLPVEVSVAHPAERAMFDLGQRMFHFQVGPHDFSWATCHGQEGRRIRMQDLPYIPAKEGAAAGWTSWPAYRVSAGQMWSMQWRIDDCFRQQYFPEPVYASDMTVALSMFMAATANGATMASNAWCRTRRRHSALTPPSPTAPPAPSARKRSRPPISPASNGQPMESSSATGAPASASPRVAAA
jgi:sulfur-oxidizing protein SoxA